MRKITFTLLVLFHVNAFAGPDWGGLVSGGGYFLMHGGNKPKPGEGAGIFRLSLGYEESELYDQKPDEASIKEFDKTKGGWAQFDFGFLCYIHIGYAFAEDGEMQFNFNNGGVRETKFKYDYMQYGLKLMIPFPYVNPYIGAGILSGDSKASSDTAAGKVSEHSRLLGRYWHAGIDLLLTPYVGLRVSYQNNTNRTRKYQALGNTKMEFEQHIGQAGLLFYF